MAANLEMNVASSDEMNVASAVPEVGGGGLAKRCATPCDMECEERIAHTDGVTTNPTVDCCDTLSGGTVIIESSGQHSDSAMDYTAVTERLNGSSDDDGDDSTSGAGSAAVDISFDKVQLSTPECQYHAEGVHTRKPVKRLASRTRKSPFCPIVELEDVDVDTNSADGKDTAIDGSSLEKTQWIPNFINACRDFIGLEYNFEHFCIHYAPIPRDHMAYYNKLDGGIYVMKYLELWDPLVDMERFFEPIDIVSIRVKYVKHLVFTSHNLMEDANALLADHETMVKRKWAPFKRAGWPFV
nr:unnamed protein product [Digitaria exilis]